jgi:O-antigen ligase
VAGIYIGLECKKSTIVWLFEAFSILILLGDLWAVYRQPAFAIMTGPGVAGAWSGLFWWKAYTGEITAFAAIMFLFRWLNFRKNRWFITVYGLVFYLLAIFLLIKAESATELLALMAAHCIAALALAYIKWGHNLKPQHWWTIGGVSLVLLAAAWFERGALLGLIGRNESLTGRVPLWEAIFPFIQKRFWLGYGFGEAFWKNDSLAQIVRTALSWNVPHAHNGFIEAMLDTGIVGLVIWLAFIIQVCYFSVRYLFRELTIPAGIFLAWMAFIVVSNLADNMLASYEYFTLFLLTIMFAFLIRGEIDKKHPILADSSHP